MVTRLRHNVCLMRAIYTLYDLAALGPIELLSILAFLYVILPSLILLDHCFFPT